MTLLVGQNGAGWTQVNNAIAQVSGNAFYFAAGYTAVATGNMTNAHFQAGTSNPIFAKVYVYQGTIGTSTTLVATSNPIDVSATGDRSANITGSITSGQLYTLVLQFSSSSVQGVINNGSGGFVDNQNLSSQITYGSPPTNLPAPNSSVGHEFIVWIDGTVGPTLNILGQAQL